MFERLKVGDYVEGCEMYGHKIVYIRGWIDKIRYVYDKIAYCSICCDDSYDRARGNSLIIDSKYPIRKVVRFEEKWYDKCNRFEKGREYFYRIGLDKDFLTSKDVIRFWDIDGVLAVFAYGEYGINVCDDADYEEMFKEHDPYIGAVAPDFIKEYLFNYTNKENNYVISRAFGEKEKESKLLFIERQYGEYIKTENIYFVDGIDKTGVMESILKNKDVKHCLYDDNISVLSLVQQKGFVGIHISSLLTLATLEY